MRKPNRPPFPRSGEMLECVGGPKDGAQLPTFGQREVYFPLPQPIRIAAYEDIPSTVPNHRVGVYEITLMVRTVDGSPISEFYVLKWVGERF